MPPKEPVLTVLLLLVVGFTTYRGLVSYAFRERLIFDTQAVRRGEYHRLISSALLHADWWHFAFNAFSFYFFAGPLEASRGGHVLLLILVAGIAGGSLLSLALHRREAQRALGASGGVCAVIFAYTFLEPTAQVMIFPIPIPIPGYIYAIAFLAYSFYGMRRNRGRIGHDAHFGGALVGLLVVALLEPRAVAARPGLFVMLAGLSGFFLFMAFKGYNPLTGSRRVRETQPQQPAASSAGEVDRILDKITSEGLQSLSERERRILRNSSRKGQGR